MIIVVEANNYKKAKEHKMKQEKFLPINSDITLSTLSLLSSWITKKIIIKMRFNQEGKLSDEEIQEIIKEARKTYIQEVIIDRAKELGA